MPGSRERLIHVLTRIQRNGERSLFFVSPRPGSGSPAGAAEGIASEDVRGRAAGDPRSGPGAVPGSAAERHVQTSWTEMEERVRTCTRCRLCQTRTNAVFGSGTRRTRLFILGEGPGAQEDLRGEAFVGPAGELLTKILRAIGFERDQVFITNVVKCRPPANRAPLPDEVAACASYLDAQLDLVRPAAILSLGASATRRLLDTTLPIGRLRGRVHLYREIPVVPTYHPAALLRSPEYKRPTWEDVQLLRRVYDERLEAAPASAGTRASGSHP
ncbi:MAG: uracil-DNA glycosylase [Gemmatimonadota bacterium]